MMEEVMAMVLNRVTRKRQRDHDAGKGRCWWRAGRRGRSGGSAAGSACTRGPPPQRRARKPPPHQPGVAVREQHAPDDGVEQVEADEGVLGPSREVDEASSRASRSSPICSAGLDPAGAEVGDRAGGARNRYAEEDQDVVEEDDHSDGDRLLHREVDAEDVRAGDDGEAQAREEQPADPDEPPEAVEQLLLRGAQRPAWWRVQPPSVVARSLRSRWVRVRARPRARGQLH